MSLKTDARQRKKTIEKVLISASGASDALLNRVYFDRIITLEDIFNNLRTR